MKGKKNKLNKVISIILSMAMIFLVIYFVTTKLNFELIKEWTPFVSKGLGDTLFFALSSAIIGATLGILLALMKNSNNYFLNYFVSSYVDIFRGTPLLVQLFIIYYGLPQFGIDLGPAISAISTFSLNSAAYISEIIRGGINSIDKGQIEAAKALGVSKNDIYKDIILPIAIKNILPSLINEFITLIKETSIISTIGVMDLMRRAQIVATQTFFFFEPYAIVAIIYYIVIKILTIISKRVEDKLKYD